MRSVQWRFHFHGVNLASCSKRDKKNVAISFMNENRCNNVNEGPTLKGLPSTATGEWQIPSRGSEVRMNRLARDNGEATGTQKTGNKQEM